MSEYFDEADVAISKEEATEREEAAAQQKRDAKESFDKLEAAITEKRDELLDKAEAAMKVARELNEVEVEIVNYARQIRNPVDAKRAAKMFEWLARGSMYRAIALQLAEADGAAAVAAEQVAEASFEAARTGLE